MGSDSIFYCLTVTWQAFAYDIRNLQVPRFFLSEDDAEGALRRWTPNEVNYGMDPWHLLHGAGVTEFLFLEPDFDTPGVNGRSGTYRWITDEKEARKNAKSYYRWSEGIDVQDNVLYVVTKQDKRLFQINLDDNTYSFFSTQSGLFDVSVSMWLMFVLALCTFVSLFVLYILLCYNRANPTKLKVFCEMMEPR